MPDYSNPIMSASDDVDDTDPALPVSVLDCAIGRGVKASDGDLFTGADIEAVGLPFFGGCQCCAASIACYNAYPSQTGYLRCRDCIGEIGFPTTAAFEEWCKANDANPVDDEDDYRTTNDVGSN